MLIDPKETLYGYPTMTIRAALRAFPSSDWSGCSPAVLKRIIPAPEKAHELTLRLVQEGYLEAFKSSDGYFHRTQKGHRFAMASARPLSRKVADRLLSGVVQRAKEINENEEYCFTVGVLVVFGSYLDQEKQKLGDLDVAFNLCDRYSREGDEKSTPMRQAMDRRHRAARMEGRRFSNITEEVYWPELEVRAKLKSGAQGLSLHDFRLDGGVVLSGPHCVVFGELPEVRASI